MWRYGDRVEIRKGMGVDLSMDLCAQACGLVGASECVCAQHREHRGGADRAEGQNDGREEE